MSETFPACCFIPRLVLTIKIVCFGKFANDFMKDLKWTKLIQI